MVTDISLGSTKGNHPVCMVKRKKEIKTTAEIVPMSRHIQKGLKETDIFQLHCIQGGSLGTLAQKKCNAALE